MKDLISQDVECTLFRTAFDTLSYTPATLGNYFADVVNGKYKQPVENVRALVASGRQEEANACKKNLPLLVADPIVLRRYERPQRERVRTALRKGIITSLGYILMLLLISGLREFLGAGALMGTQVMKNALFPMAQLPSGGFILLALVMCVWRAAAASVKQQMSLGAEHL